MKPYMKVTKDLTEQLKASITKFKNDQVLVGIPEENTQRKDGEVSNAMLLAIQNFGSPATNIPAWPTMAIGIRNAQDAIFKQFKLAVTQSLSNGFAAIDQYYERAGIIASNSIKKVINDQELAPAGRPLAGTLKARERRGFKGDKYWLVTGQLRNAITYVVRGRRGSKP